MRDSHYWKIHKHIFWRFWAKLLTHDNRATIAADSEQRVPITRWFYDMVDKEVERIYNDASHPYNDPYTFRSPVIEPLA
jgi:hypothetical protein